MHTLFIVFALFFLVLGLVLSFFDLGMSITLFQGSAMFFLLAGLSGMLQ